MNIVEAYRRLLGRSKKPLSMDERLAKTKDPYEQVEIIRECQAESLRVYQAERPARIAARIAARGSTPPTAKYYRSFAENYLDPLGKDRRGVGDYSPEELDNAVDSVALHFANEEGAPEEVLREMTGERK